MTLRREGSGASKTLEKAPLLQSLRLYRDSDNLMDRTVRFLIRMSVLWMIFVTVVSFAKYQANEIVFQPYVPKNSPRAATGGAQATPNSPTSSPSTDQRGADPAANNVVETSKTKSTTSVPQTANSIPKDTLSFFGSYPNVLNITDYDRSRFYPVIKFPLIWSEDNGQKVRKPNYQVLDLRTVKGADLLVSDEERNLIRMGVRDPPRYNDRGFRIGRYDERRVNMYSSDMFQDSSRTVDGYGGTRNLFLGIDLYAPMGTKVYAFCDGVIYKKGYNGHLGDFGNVIVVQHDLGPDAKTGKPRRLWALYGHLDDTSILSVSEGTVVKKGRILGKMGDVDANGGWRISRLHFQLALQAPGSHDMPAVVSMRDRSKALLNYPDPRLVLGPLY